MGHKIQHQPEDTEDVFPEVKPNDCFVSDNLTTSAQSLLIGYHLTPLNFADLCNLIEIIILHEHVITAFPPPPETPLDLLYWKGILRHTLQPSAPSESEDENSPKFRIAWTASRTLTDGGVWGRGLMNLEALESEIVTAVDRITMAHLILHYESGGKIHPKNKKLLQLINKQYKVFKEYAEAVFNAAQHYHVHAYTGSSEIPYAIKKSVKSLPRLLYGKLCELHKERVDKFLVEAGFRTYTIPPFASIVLSRAKSREDIIYQALRAREEFSEFRQTCTAYSENLQSANTYGDIAQLHNDFDEGITLLTKKVTKTGKDSRFTFRLWDIVKEGTPWGIGKALFDRLKQYDIDRQTLKAVNGLFDVWKKLQHSATYEKVLHSEMFLHGDYHEFQEDTFQMYSNYLDSIKRYLPVHESDQGQSSEQKGGSGK